MTPATQSPPMPRTGAPAHARHAGHAAPAGLTASAAGLTLEPGLRRAPRGSGGEYAFRITGRGGVVRDFDAEHGKRMHMIVVRRDLTRFQHLHPEMDADGTWRTPLDLDAPGTYRVFADFAHAGRGATLGVDLLVPGHAEREPLPAPAPVADADGYSVEMIAGYGVPGAQELAFRVSRDGVPVDALEPYLGARGHLVALRSDDLAFLHVHPLDGLPGPEVRFHVAWPSHGAYRLFLQVQHEGRIVTAPFTVVVP